MYQWYGCVAAIAALYMAGCGPDPMAGSAWPESRPLGHQLNTYRPPADSENHAEIDAVFDLPDPVGELTLQRAMALAVSRSPKLRAYGWDVRRAEAKALQAGLWPNPELGAEFENFGGNKEFSGTDSLETTISLAQTFPIGGDVGRRRELANYESQLAGWDYEAARLEVLTEVTQRYVMLLMAQRQIAVSREALDLAEQVREATQKRIDAGDAPPIELARASVPVATAGIELRRAERAMKSARKQLALTWGSSEPTFDESVGSLEQIHEPPSPEHLVSLINQSPEVARWATEISARRAEVRLAKAEAVPDVTGSLGYRRFNESDADALVAGISLPLPVFDRRQGDILAARIGATSATQRRREAELRLESMLSDAYARLVGAYDEAVAIRDEALPPAVEAFEVTRRAFEQGDLGFIDVIDAERTLIELRRRHLDALANFHSAVAEIEGLIGQPLEQMIPADIPNEPEQEGVDLP